MPINAAALKAQQVSPKDFNKFGVINEADRFAQLKKADKYGNPLVDSKFVGSFSATKQGSVELL